MCQPESPNKQLQTRVKAQENPAVNLQENNYLQPERKKRGAHTRRGCLLVCLFCSFSTRRKKTKKRRRREWRRLCRARTGGERKKATERGETAWKNRPVRTIQQACIGALSVTLPQFKTNPILCRILQKPSDFCSILYSSLLKLFFFCHTTPNSIHILFVYELQTPLWLIFLKLLQVVILPKRKKKT